MSDGMHSNGAKPDMAGASLAQALDAAVASYQRHFGRLRTIDKLKHMAGRAEEAQRVMEEAGRGG